MTTWKPSPYNGKVKVVPTPTGFSATLEPGSSNNLNGVSIHRTFSLGKDVTFRYRVSTVSGAPVFKATEGTAPANFSLMFGRGLLDERWYVTDAGLVRLNDELDQGPQSKTVRLSPEFWTDVNGRQDVNKFAAEIKDAVIAEIVFGGQFRAHGVYVEGGTAKFEFLGFV